MGDRIVVGVLAGAFGVRGEVRLKSFCAEPEAIAGYAPLVAADGRLLGVLDLDSPSPARFDAEDEAGCATLAQVLISALAA